MLSQAAQDILSAKMEIMAGVGDDEMTAEEHKAALQIGHGILQQIYEKGIASVIPPSSEPEIPADVGQFRIFPYSLPATQPPYRVPGSPDIEKKLNDLHERDRSPGLGNTMVAACAAGVAEGPDMLECQPLQSDEQIIMFLCGGGFISSDIPSLKWLYIRLSQELQQRVFVPRYSVAPQHVFPRPIHDVYTALHFLQASGFALRNITLVCISAGANIGMATLQLLQSEPVKGAVIISPCLDLTLSMDSWRRNQDKCVLHYTPLENPLSMPRVYFGDVDDLGVFSHPLLSPLNADHTAWPPLLIQTGTDDAMVDEAVELARRIREVDPEGVDLEVYPDCNHYSILRGRSQLDKVYQRVRTFVDGLVTQV
ncbi:hypothetical protein GGF46_005301 [Coemansia sp. RSA 552]|nr:hypothetical protein GGF46_005301 [Coemansia sp. RSA 552]